MDEPICASSTGSFYVLLAQGPAFFVHSLAKALQSGNHGDRPVPTPQIITCRMVLTLIPGLLYLYYKSVPNFILGDKDVRYLLVIRAVAGSIGVGGFYASMIYLPLVEATVISFLSPLLTTIASKMVARSSLSLRQIGASCLCFSGVVCVTLSRTISYKTHHQGADSSVAGAAPSLGILIALIGVIGSSITILSVRKIGPRAHPLITMNYLAYFMLLVSFFFPFLPFDSFAYTWDLQLIEWIMLFGIGLLAFVMEILQTYGFSLDSSPRAVNMLYSQAILALGADILVWKTDFSPLSIIGVVAIVVGLIFVDDTLPSNSGSGSLTTLEPAISLQDMNGVSFTELAAP